MRTIILSFAVLVGSLATDVNAQVQVVESHPRLYLRPGELEALRARVRDEPSIGAFYAQLKTRMDNTTTPHSNNEVRGFELKSLALLHVIEQGTMYRDKALQGWLRTSYTPGTVGHWDRPFQVMAQALALDWMWNDLTSQQRTNLGRALVSMMDEIYNQAPHDIGPDPRWANQMSDYSNQLYYWLGSLAFAGGVLADEGIDDARAAFYLSEAKHLIENHMVAAMNQQAGGDAEMWLTEGFQGEGGWGEDTGHLEMTHPFLGRMLEAWRTATGHDYFPQFNGLATITQYALYLRRPGGNLSPKGNGTYNSRIADKHMGALGALNTARYGDPFGKRVKDISYSGNTYGFHQVGPVLWYDPSVPDLDDDSLPRAMNFRGQGEVVVRSGFESHDTWVYLRSGPIYNGHQHDDQGNLLIEAYGGELIVEDAASGRKATSFHSTLLVGGNQIPYGNNQVQYVRPLEGTDFERGKLTDFQTNDTFHYVASDFGNAYPDSVVPPPKDDKVVREVVVILPDIVVVRDRVTSNAQTEVLWHTWQRSSVQVDESAGHMTIIDGAGHAFLGTLLPANAQIVHQPGDPTNITTIRAAEATPILTFLHVFYLSSSQAPFVPNDLVLIDDEVSIGAWLTDSEGDSWTIRFQRDGVGLLEVLRNDEVVDDPPTNGQPDDPPGDGEHDDPPGNGEPDDPPGNGEPDNGAHPAEPDDGSHSPIDSEGGCSCASATDRELPWVLLAAVLVLVLVLVPGRRSIAGGRSKRV